MYDIDILCVGYGETGSTPKHQNEVEVDKLPKAIHATAMKEAFPLDGMYKFFPRRDNLQIDVQVAMNDLDILCVCYGDTGSKQKDSNDVEVDKLSKAVLATDMKEVIPFILFGEAKDNNADYFGLMLNEFAGVLKNGENATIERLHYMPRHEFELRAKVWNSCIIYVLSG